MNRRVKDYSRTRHGSRVINYDWTKSRNTVRNNSKKDDFSHTQRKSAVLLHWERRLDQLEECNLKPSQGSKSPQHLIIWLDISVYILYREYRPIWFFQSLGLGTKAGLMQYVQGTFSLSKIPGPFRNDMGEIPKVEERKLLMISPTLWGMLSFGRTDIWVEIYPCHWIVSAAV